MKKLIILFMLGISFVHVWGQLKVNSSGAVVVGNNANSFPIYGNPTMSILGANNNAPKLAFNQGNVFIGEYGPSSSDILWLNATNGIVMTMNGQNVAYFDYEYPERFDFNTNIYAQGFVQTSDERFKTNVKNITNSLGLIKQLKGVTYNYTDKLSERGKIETIDLAKVNSPKEQARLQKLQKIEERQKARNNKQHHGFIAQELQTVFPELVEQDSTGYCHVDYVSLIPVIVEAIKEQQQQIEEQQEQINQLTKLLGAKSLPQEKFLAEKGIEAMPYLMQNTPNPFNQLTEIGFYIPDNIQTANLYIYDINGLQQQHIPIIDRGNGQVSLSASSLKAGIYFYTLICDGKPIDSKQMVLTK